MAQGDKITELRKAAFWEIGSYLDMTDDTNTFLRNIKNQPDGVYAEANISEMAIWLKWELGRDNKLARWWPALVYQDVINKIVDFPYNEPVIPDLYLPPENAAGGVGGKCSCDSDAYGSPARTAINFKLNETTRVWTEQAAGSEAGGTWTFTEAAGVYAMCWEDALTEDWFPTKQVTVT